MRSVILAAMALAAGSPAFAQAPADRAPKLVTGPTAEVIKEAVNTIKLSGECMVEFTISKEGKAKDLKPTCTPEAYTPYVLRAMEGVEYLPEIFAGEVWDTEGQRQPFKFTGPSVAASTVKQAVVVKNVDPRDISKALNKVDEPGVCQLEFTVGVDGKPKDIAPNCTPEAYNKPIADAIKKMTYQPAEKDGQKVEAKVAMPLNLTKPD
jgi:hypothetical protein